jgi:hypothetical protein
VRRPRPPWGLLASTLCFALVPACVLPIGPQFQDPPATANVAPEIFNADPPLGSVVTVPRFLVTVSDPNLGDDLLVRFIADFPPYTSNTKVLKETPVPHRADGTPLRQDVPVEPNCLLNSLAKIPQHQIMVVVSDRGFADPVDPLSKQIDLTRIPDDGRKIVASWTLDLECK